MNWIQRLLARLGAPVGASLSADIATVKAQTDKIAGKMLFSMDFWSDTQEELEVDAAGGTETLPSVTVEDLPDGAAIVRAIAMFKFRMVENTHAGANGLNGAQHIQVQSNAPGTWRDAISIVDTLCTFTEAARESGDVWIGDHNIEVEITAHLDDIYSFQWVADALQEFIRFNDVQTGLRIWYSI
ncbi:hypothetical protein ES703_89403 [subsurface metagenome]